MHLRLLPVLEALVSEIFLCFLSSLESSSYLDTFDTKYMLSPPPSLSLVASSRPGHVDIHT